MNKRKVIFDCDIGCDDAIALISLLLSENIDIIAITTVKGNIDAKDAAYNALKVCHLLKKDIPVYEGCNEPMVRNLLKGRNYNTLMQTIHKEIDGKEILIHERSFDLPLPERKIEEKHAVTYILETLKNTKEKIDICAIGPLTNMAMAIRLDPTIINNIGTIYIMGGGLQIGNRTPVAEANFYDDPEAAQIVINSKANCMICPIEPCEMAATYTHDDLKEIKNINNDISNFVYDNLINYINRCNILFETDINSCCVYDFAAVMPLLDENSIIKKEKDIVHIDITGGMSDGQMVIDRRNMFHNNGLVEVIYEMDPKITHDYLLTKLKNI